MSSLGLGFWCPLHQTGFMHVFPMLTTSPTTSPSIFYQEALAVLSALHWCTSHLSLPVHTCVAIFLDNTNMVGIFNSLHVQPDYNRLLATVVNLLLQHHLQLHVCKGNPTNPWNITLDLGRGNQK